MNGGVCYEPHYRVNHTIHVPTLFTITSMLRSSALRSFWKNYTKQYYMFLQTCIFFSFGMQLKIGYRNSMYMDVHIDSYGIIYGPKIT